MVAFIYWPAGAAGTSVLHWRGNAADAAATAVAVGFVLRVVGPHLNGRSATLLALRAL